jgi:hypothetical protein
VVHVPVDGMQAAPPVVVIGQLPNSYRDFQAELSSQLAAQHPELSEALCREVMLRQLASANVGMPRLVLTPFSPPSPFIFPVQFSFLLRSIRHSMLPSAVLRTHSIPRGLAP